MFKERDMSPNARLSVLERAAYGSGSVATGFMAAAVSTFLLFYYTDVVGLNGATIGTIFLISRIFDGISDLGMGYIIDRTKPNKYGKGRL